MNIKQALSISFLDILKFMLGKNQQNQVKKFLVSGKIPWTNGYQVYKFDLIKSILKDEKLLSTFAEKQTLPNHFGYGLDERCVEYPWLFSHLPENAQTILDAGSILNHEIIINQPHLKNKKIHILTLAPEENCFYQHKISYLYDDLRQIPIQNNYYDAIICLSTLEHIGCDNSHYTNEPAGQENRPQDFIQAIQELKRVLKPGGNLFLSVPYGKYKNHGLFQQFDRQLLTQAIQAFGDYQSLTETFYKYDKNGWQITTDQACEDCEYAQWVVNLWQTGQTPSKELVDPDYAAAARAVACIQLII